jgi:hypothetical protein
MQHNAPKSQHRERLPLATEMRPSAHLPIQLARKFVRFLQPSALGSLLAVGATALACSATGGSPVENGSGGALSSGGAVGNGGGQVGIGGAQGNSGAIGAAANGGQAVVGGSGAVAGSGNAGGNSSATGGAGGAGAGGSSTAGFGPGGAGAGGSSRGGSGPGGAGAGASSSGGSGLGGAGAGGSSSGGAATGGAGAGGGGNCPFPTSFKWSSTGALADPKSPSGHTFVSLKDFTVAKSGAQFVVYASVFDTTANAYSGVNINFTDWTQMGAATQTYMGSEPTGATVAPTIFHFTPKNLWVLTYQWGFKYATATDPTKPATWSSPKTLLTGGPAAAIDQTVICDSTNCYLFFAGDNGNIYRSSMPIGNFPGTFSGSTIILTDAQNSLFEAVEVYTVKGTGKYLMIVEAIGGGGRYFRAFSATSLGGTFTAVPGASTEATPFAGKNNVTFTSGAWTNDISHGDIVRTDPSETQTVDPCDMQFLYQGFDKTKSSSVYNSIPYRPGLLTKTN